MVKQYKTARAIHANRGIEAKYKKALQSAIDNMHNSYVYWLTAGYKKEPPKVATLVDIAQDALPSKMIQKLLKALGRRWIDKFEDFAKAMSEKYVGRMYKFSDTEFRQSLKDVGWSVDFKMTPAMKDALESSIAENIALIKSIPVQYLNQVEGAVMRSYSAGRDLATMVKDIQAIYPVTKRRAAFIAIDQSNKANAVVNRVRQLELGITEAIWLHSHAGKVPRKSHVAANGKKYSIADGCLIDGEKIQPGTLPRCRCVSRPILPI